MIAGRKDYSSWRNTLDDAKAAGSDMAAMLDMAQSDMRPASKAAIAQAAVILSGLPSQANSGDSAKAAQAVFEIGLADMPADLLPVAVERACKTCRWRPAPIQLLELVADELTERRLRIERLRMIESMGVEA